MVHAIFTLHGIPAAIVGGGLQAPLYGFAEADVFLLHLMAERHRFLNTLFHAGGFFIMKIPFEDRERLIV